VAGRWFFPGTPVYSTNNIDRQNITEILLKVDLNTITQATTNRPNDYFELSKETIYPSCFQCSIILGIEKYTLQVFDYLIKMSQVSGEGLLKVILGTVVLLEFEKTYPIYSVIRLTSKVNRHRIVSFDNSK
jgi:hypothetical protein